MTNTDLVLQRTRLKTPNAVVWQMRDREGRIVGYLSRPYDGTPEDAVQAWYALHDENKRVAWAYDVSGINSAVVATGPTGRPRYEISWNGRVVTELGATR